MEADGNRKKWDIYIFAVADFGTYPQGISIRFFLGRYGNEVWSMDL